MNRYERLVGHMYRQLVADTQRIMSNGSNADVVASVLQFKSFNESFYYVGTHFNPLVRPCDVNHVLSELKKVKLLKTAPNLFRYMGAYFGSQSGAYQIRDVFDESDKLALANASTFNITYAGFRDLKDLWLEWIDTNSSCFLERDFASRYDSETLIFQSFLLTNFLLTLMPIPYSVNSDNSSSTTYRALTQKNWSDFPNSIWVDMETGRFKTNRHEPYMWKYVERAELRHGQLLDLVEFVLVQPVSAIEKEQLLLKLYESLVADGITGEIQLPEYEMSALARPLIHNSEFQGIVYVAKMFDDEKGGFTEDDDLKFGNVINMLQVRSRLHEAGFDLARMALLRKDASDWNDPSLLRILNIMHVFTSASAAIAAFEDPQGDPVAYERYKTADEMETITRTNASHITTTIESVFSARPFEVGALWFSDQDPECERLLSLPTNGARESNSVLLMSFSLPQQGKGYLVLFYRFKLRKNADDDQEFQYSQFKRSVGWDVSSKVFSKQLHNYIERLIDADCEHKKLISYEREHSLYFIQGLSLLTAHDVRNKFEPLIVTPLKDIADELQYTARDQQTHIRAIASYAERLLNQSGKYTTAFRNFFHLKMNNPEHLSLDPWRFTSQQFEALFSDLHAVYSSVDSGAGKMDLQIQGCDHVLTGINREICEFLLDQLLSNATEADRENKVSSDARQYRVIWRPVKSDHRNSKTSIQISVWNAGRHIPEYIVRTAGKGIRKRPREGHTGLGFYFLEYALSQLGAHQYEDERHFRIDNTSAPRGVEVSFVLPAIMV